MDEPTDEEKATLWNWQIPEVELCGSCDGKVAPVADCVECGGTGRTRPEPKGVPGVVAGLRTFTTAPGSTGGAREQAVLDCPVCGIGAILDKPQSAAEVELLLARRLVALVDHYLKDHGLPLRRAHNDWLIQLAWLLAWVGDPGKSAQSG